MKMQIILCLLLLLTLVFCACGGEGSPTPYQAEHEHSFGASHDIAPEEGGEVTQQVRYCKICHKEQIHPKQS